MYMLTHRLLPAAIFCLLCLRPELVAALHRCCVTSTNAYIPHVMPDCLTETASAGQLAQAGLCFTQCPRA